MMTIENVTSKKQIAAVKALAHAIWHEHYTPIIGADQVAYMLANFQSTQAISRQIRSGSLYYLFKNGEKPVGYMCIEKRDDALFLSKLYISAEERNKGYAKEACIFLEELARQKKLPRIELTVNKNNSLAISSYEKLGFTNEGSTVQPIGNGFVMDDYVMEKRLGERAVAPADAITL